MIFTGFKRKSNQLFFKNRLPALLKSYTTISSKKVKNILVFLDDIEEENTIKNSLFEIFSNAENEIKLVIFQKKGTKEQNLEAVITPKDFGWYGKINSEKLKTILTKKYDLLINYSKIDNLYSNLLLLQCKVGFKVGFTHLDNRFYDLLINCQFFDIESFNKELKKYLVILNKI